MSEFNLDELQHNLFQIKQLVVALEDYDERLGDRLIDYRKNWNRDNEAAVAYEANYQSDIVLNIHMVIYDMLERADEGIDQMFKDQFAEMKAAENAS